MRSITESYKRKLASEDGWVLKRGAQLRIALCYPNVYSIGMANLGFQAMYELFNNIPEVSCERVFLPDSGRSVKVSEGSVSTSRVGQSSSANQSVRSPRVSKGSPRNHALPNGRASDTSGYDAKPRDQAITPIDELREYERTRTPLLSLESQTK